MAHISLRTALVGAAAIVFVGVMAVAAQAASERQIARGKYLVTFGGCNDCHTPGYFLGKPDFSRALGGSDVGFELPGMGTFYGPNITPDKDTGIGNWTSKQIVTAIQTGKRPDGRELAPIMPWHAFANLNKRDVNAIVAYLKSLPPVHNKAPGPFGPNDKPTSFVYRIIPPSP